jgi:hypothetical protein
MGKLKEHYAEDINRTHVLAQCATDHDNRLESYADWCQHQIYVHRNSYVPSDPLVSSLRRRIVSAQYVLRNRNEPYGIDYHVFEVESALLALEQFLTKNQL